MKHVIRKLKQSTRGIYHLTFDEAYFTNDDHKVCYYTGLPNREMLLSTFELVIPLPGLKREYYWRSYLIILMELKLNLG